MSVYGPAFFLGGSAGGSRGSAEIVQAGHCQVFEPVPFLVVGDEKGGVIEDGSSDDDGVGRAKSVNCPEFGSLQQDRPCHGGEEEVGKTGEKKFVFVGYVGEIEFQWANQKLMERQLRSNPSAFPGLDPVQDERRQFDV